MGIQNYLILALGLAVSGLGVLYRRHKAKELESLSDVEFLERFSQRHSAPADAVLRERNRVARIFGIPREKLSPDQSIEELSKRFGYLTDFMLAWDCLDDEIIELRREAGTDTNLGPPSTVGQLVAELAQLRE
jgi:hypothetical protein